MKHLLKDEKILSILLTIFIHLLLLFLFLAIKVDFRPVMSEFVELSFAGGFVAPEPSSDLNPSEVMEPKAEKTAVSEPVKEVELPERRQLDLNEEEILSRVQPEIEKISEPPSVGKKLPANQPTIRREAPGRELAFSRKEKEIPKGIFRKEESERTTPGTQKIDLAVDKTFEIDWQGNIKREIYQKRLPDFPPDVQREAVIKIQFTVLPNGLVGSAVLLQKGETRLENLTLETFKTWRFNPLPPYVPQEPQTGIITFRFKLQ